jgi:GNAT superfamily N-acetyltransferase
MTGTGKVRIAMLPGTAAGDIPLMETISRLINEVYAVAEQGLWVDGASRTTVSQVTELTRASQIATARAGSELAGCVRIQRLGHGTAEFGMLAVAPAYRGLAVGSELVGFAEHFGRQNGCHIMQLEVLMPRHWRHPSKEFLTGWYTRIGYELARTGTIEESYPDLALFLATPCDFVIYRKSLAGRTGVRPDRGRAR